MVLAAVYQLVCFIVLFGLFICFIHNSIILQKLLFCKKSKNIYSIPKRYRTLPSPRTQDPGGFPASLFVNYENGGYAERYKDFRKTKVIGRIEYNLIQRSQKENILTITWFLVKPNERKKGIGKELLQYVVQFAKASNISKIWVIPTPFAEQENDCKLPLEFVYAIYEHLGFQFANPNADRKKEGNKMYLSVK